MTPEMLITLSVLVVAVVLFMTDKLRVDIVALGVIITLLAFNIITTSEALAGFSSTAVISIASLFIVGTAVFQTGLASQFAQLILKVAGGNPTRLLIVLMVSVALLSGFISSTGVVALMLPAVVSIARALKISPSRLLIPLAFSALMGGSLTLIGTPPNVIVSEALTKAGYAPFSFFSFTPMGLILLGVSVGYVALFGKYILPDNPSLTAEGESISAKDVFNLVTPDQKICRVEIPLHSPAVGQTLEQISLRREFGVNVIEILRPNIIKRNGWRTRLKALFTPDSVPIALHPEANLTLQGGDTLVMQGDQEAIGYALQYWEWQRHDIKLNERDILTPEIGIAELVISPHSALIGKTLADVTFGSTYHVTVVDLKRHTTEGVIDIANTPLAFGDMLVVQGEWASINALSQSRRDFVVISDVDATQFGAFARREKAPFALFWLVFMVFLMVFNIAELTLAGLIAAVGMVLTGCLSMDEAYDGIDWKSLVLIAGMMPMSTALVRVGIVDGLAQGVVGAFGQYGELAVLTCLCLITVVFTQILSNTATTLLLAPLAISTAQTLQAEPQAFLLGVALCASMAFATPIASPVNTLVLTAGNYAFKDYLKAGLPLTVVCLVLAVIILPILYPL